MSETPYKGKLVCSIEILIFLQLEKNMSDCLDYYCAAGVMLFGSSETQLYTSLGSTTDVSKELVKCYPFSSYQHFSSVMGLSKGPQPTKGQLCV